MPIGADFALDWRDKVIRHINGTSVYSVNQLFTWVQQQIPQPQNMDDDEIMTAETPTAYTIKDDWWLDIGETSEAYKYLRGGAIQTNGYLNNVLLITLAAGGYTSFVPGDIGLMVTDDAADVGPLLGYNNTTREI